MHLTTRAPPSFGTTSDLHQFVDWIAQEADRPASTRGNLVDLVVSGDTASEGSGSGGTRYKAHIHFSRASVKPSVIGTYDWVHPFTHEHDDDEPFDGGKYVEEQLGYLGRQLRARNPSYSPHVEGSGLSASLHVNYVA